MLQLKPEGLDLADALSRPIAMCGCQFVADNSGALYWPAQGALLVADLHLADMPEGGRTNGLGSASTGNARRALVKLAEVMDRYEPAKVLVLGEGAGESAGESATSAGMTEEDVEILRILQEDRDWVWITGLETGRAAPHLGGRACPELEIGGIRLRPRPTPGWATHEIAASLHPEAHLSMYGYSLRRACFVGNGRRLVLPAFGASPGKGVNVLDEAFRPLFGTGGMAVWMLGHEGLYPVATRLLAAD
jgi:metallophosphoesterase superfamily enzyme